MGIQIQKFRASTLQKAIEEVRAELGDDAIILQTETIRDSKLGLLGKTQVEVTAAIDRKDPIRFHATLSEEKNERASVKPSNDEKKSWWKAMLPPKKVILAQGDGPEKAAAQAKVKGPATRAPAVVPESMNQMYAIQTFVEPLQRELAALKSKVETSAPVPVAASTLPGSPLTKAPRKRLQDPLEIEVQQLRSELSTFILEKRYEHLQLSPYFRQLVHFWTAKGMSGKQILSFLNQIEKSEGPLTSDNSAESSLLGALGLAIHEATSPQKQEPRIVILIGATGVGKTTTLAKMGAHEKMRLKRSICFVSVDDYKIGGADQMQSYARILEAPFVRSRKDLSLEDQISVQKADTIFVDTFGISPNDRDRMQELKKMISFSRPELAARVEVHLVMPVGIPSKDVQTILKSFEILEPKYLLFTKWDETENWGGMLSSILESKKPVSFVCYGQSVPDDMSAFSSRDFISRVMSIESNEKLN